MIEFETSVTGCKLSITEHKVRIAERKGFSTKLTRGVTWRSLQVATSIKMHPFSSIWLHLAYMAIVLWIERGSCMRNTPRDWSYQVVHDSTMTA